MFKRILKSVLLMVSVLVLMGAGYSEGTVNPLIGKYTWHNLHFNTYHEIEITEKDFYGNGYKTTGISGRQVSMTVYEFHGKHPVEFIVSVDKDDPNLYYFARKDCKGEFTVIATARRK